MVRGSQTGPMADIDCLLLRCQLSMFDCSHASQAIAHQVQKWRMLLYAKSACFKDRAHRWLTMIAHWGVESEKVTIRYMSDMRSGPTIHSTQ